MFLAKVKGHVVASQKDPAISGPKLLIIEPLKLDYESDGGGVLGNTNRAIVAIDRVGAGAGSLVLVVQGSSSRLAEGLKDMPIDAAIIGIVDEAVVGGKKLEKNSV